MVFWSIVMNRWKTGNNLSSQRCTPIHHQSCTYKTYLDDNTFCCAITQLLIIKGEHRRENLLTISLAPTNITMGKVSSLNVTGNVHWRLFRLIILTSHFIVDHILRRQKFPGSASWVHERLCWPSPLLQPLQLYPSGEWLFCGLWEIPLHGPPVLLAQGGVLWQPAHDWYQWLYPILPYDSSGESKMKKKHRRIICVRLWVSNGLWFFSSCSTVVPTKYDCTSDKTWPAKCRRSATTTPTSKTACACPTLTPAMWLMATGCCMTSPTTREEPTICGLESTAGTVTGAAPVQGLVPSGGSLTSTKWLQTFIPLFVGNKHAWLKLCLLFAFFPFLGGLHSFPVFPSIKIVSDCNLWSLKNIQ